MIETRNATNTLVLSKSGINIWNISDLLLQKKSFDFLQKRSLDFSSKKQTLKYLDLFECN